MTTRNEKNRERMGEGSQITNIVKSIGTLTLTMYF